MARTDSSSSAIPAIAAIVMLVAAVFGRWPYGFYQLLRLVVCGTAIYMAFQANERRQSGWMWVMVGLAILFNPLAPITFDRATWRVFDAMTAIGLGIALSKLTRMSVKPR